LRIETLGGNSVNLIDENDGRRVLTRQSEDVADHAWALTQVLLHELRPREGGREGGREGEWKTSRTMRGPSPKYFRTNSELEKEGGREGGREGRKERGSVRWLNSR